MQALGHIMNGDLAGARQILGQIPVVEDEGIEERFLRALENSATTLSDMAREERGNREQRRAAAKARGKAHR